MESVLDTLTACEMLPTDVITFIGQFIDVKTMEEQIRFNQLTEKFERFKSRTLKEWIDIVTHFPAHFGLIHVKVCSKIIKVIEQNSPTKHYNNETFVNYCNVWANIEYHNLIQNLIDRNLSRFNPKYQGQTHVGIDGNTLVALPHTYWRWHYLDEHGCSPLYWAFTRN
jgi:hypothetical protein